MKIGKALIFGTSFRNGLYSARIFISKKIVRFVYKCRLFLKVILGFQKIQKKDLVKAEKGYQKKEK